MVTYAHYSVLTTPWISASTVTYGSRRVMSIPGNRQYSIILFSNPMTLAAFLRAPYLDRDARA